MNAHEIKQLEVRAAKAKAKKDSAFEDFEASRKAYQAAKLEFERLEQQAKKLKTGLVVTEHALLRYIERAWPVKLDEIEQYIKQSIGGQVGVLGNGTYPINASLCAVVKDNRVVTIKFGK